MSKPSFFKGAYQKVHHPLKKFFEFRSQKIYQNDRHFFSSPMVRELATENKKKKV